MEPFHFHFKKQADLSQQLKHTQKNLRRMTDAMERRRNRKSKGRKSIPDSSHKSLVQNLTQHLANRNEELKVLKGDAQSLENDSCIAHEELECDVISTKDGNKYSTKVREASHHLMNSGVSQKNVSSTLSLVSRALTVTQTTCCIVNFYGFTKLFWV